MTKLVEIKATITMSRTLYIEVPDNATEDEIIDEPIDEEENYEVDVIGVDEKEAPVNYTLILVIGAVVAAILVIIIAVVIRKRK